MNILKGKTIKSVNLIDFTDYTLFKEIKRGGKIVPQRFDVGRSWEAFGPSWAKELGKGKEREGRGAKAKGKEAKGIRVSFQRGAEVYPTVMAGTS